MTLAERLHRAIDGADRPEPILLSGDTGIVGGSGGTPAAVLMPVTDRPEPGVLLTVRHADLRHHAGQVAFPGGRIDPEDDGPIGAALREAEEEIGLPRHLVQVIGIADRYTTGTGFDIMPVLAVVPPDLVLVPQVDEVAAVFEVPLAYLLEPANHSEQVTEWQGRDRHFFEIMWEDYRIWGATAAMIVNLGRRLALAP